MTRRRAVLWCLALAALGVVIYVAIRSTRDLTDFEVYRTAGLRVLAAEPLYHVADGHFVFKYLPAFSLVMAPFALLPIEVAKAVWFGLNFTLLAAFVALSVRELPGRTRRVGALIGLTLIVTARVDLRELSLGQTNVGLGVLIAAAAAAALRGRRVRAGVLVGIATFVKPYAVLFAPWLMVTAGLPAAGACALTILAGLALPAVVYGWSGNVAEHLSWFRLVTGTSPENLRFPENISLLAVWQNWIGAGRLASALALASILGVLAVAAFVVARRTGVRAPAYLEVALLLVLIPLLSPQGWDYMLLLATPAVVCLIDRSAALGGLWSGVVLGALVVVALPLRELVGLTITRDLQAMGVMTIAAIGLAGGLAHLRFVRAA